MTRSPATAFVFIALIVRLAAAVEPTDGVVLMATGVPTDWGSVDEDIASAIAVDSAGRFVVTRSATSTTTTVVVARLLPSGLLDPDSGAGGKVIDPLGWQSAGGWTRFTQQPAA